jgi:hypothetical protein
MRVDFFNIFAPIKGPDGGIGRHASFRDKCPKIVIN